MKLVAGILSLFVLGIAVFFLLSKNTNTSLPAIISDQQNSDKNIDPNIPDTEIVAENLEVPWGMAFLPTGELLVTERQGTIKLIDLNSKKSTEIAQIENVKQVGESGLHGLAIHPNFALNPYIYIYHTYSADGENTSNRVLKYTYSNNTLSQPEIILDKIPGNIFHDGGRIKFGPDGMLYITTGDAQNPSSAQDTSSLAGKILRLTDTGEVPSDNPFGTPVYSYGHRNPQGITWDQNGNLWETEHGNKATDEVNLIEKGKNYGWPDVFGETKKAGTIAPVIQSGSETWAPTGIISTNNQLFFTGLRGQSLYRASIDSGKISSVSKLFTGEFGRLRNIIVGPDNLLYIATSNRDGRGTPNPGDDKIIRINPDKL